jgi:hypothetical protein
MGLKTDQSKILSVIKLECSKKGIDWKSENAQEIEGVIDNYIKAFTYGYKYCLSISVAVVILAIINFTAVPYLYAVAGALAALMLIGVLIVMLVMIAALFTANIMISTVLEGLNLFKSRYKTTLEE